MGKQVRIYLMTKMFINRGRRWHGFLHEGFYSKGFGVESPSNFGFIVRFWLRVLGFKGWGYFYCGVVGGKIVNFLMDFASHEVVKLCRISQNL
jgi:hypothetical protein